MLTVGIDIGSTSSKGVVIENGKSILAKKVIPLGTGTKGSESILGDVLKMAGVERKDIDRIIVTGYGRVNFNDADKQISEVSCHARGVNFLVPTVRTIIDIGGQDAKALKVDENGNLTNFVMNDKCAAGTGRFLDVMARIFDVKTEELEKIGEKSTKEVQ
jgi:predicted CoA-substrate-specific enzyme activase